VLIEEWNGRAWRIENDHADPGGGQGELTSVSCAAETFCQAVGPFTNAYGLVGRNWYPDEISQDNSLHLQSVSCPAAGSCMAVGAWAPGRVTRPYAMQYSGAGWRSRYVRNPFGGGARFQQVSCRSTTQCAAVGYEGLKEITATWSSSSWAEPRVFTDVHAHSIQITGLTCVPGAHCIIVGVENREPGEEQGVAFVSDGTSWVRRQFSTPSPAQLSELLGISCPSPSNCYAAGDFSSLRPAWFDALLEHWNGRTWSELVAPQVPDDASLVGIACPGVHDYMAVGSSLDDFRVAETDNLVEMLTPGSKAWTLVAPPRASGVSSASLTSVACPSNRWCIAIGWAFLSGVGEVDIAYTWNGAHWTYTLLPSPWGAKRTDLTSVACSAVAHCTAVGTFENASSRAEALSESLSAGRWVLHGITDPPGSTQAALTSVACPVATTRCEAVGWSASSGPSRPLAASFNGSAWVVRTPPAPAGARAGQLHGISCNTAGACSAVGWFQGADGLYYTLAERSSPSWTSGSFQIEASANVPGAPITTYDAISCPSADRCRATGAFFAGGVGLPLAERLG
jgi:hypothetical protein